MGPSTRTAVAYSSTETPGTILIDTAQKMLYLVTASNRALAYRVGVGRDGFGWTGRVAIGAKAKWPDWRPPEEMKQREPNLPDLVPAGPLNPLGARALYLYKGGADTLYRIHGTNSADTIGGNVSSGCFRLTNADAIDLYDRVRVGARVIVY
ncbi:MAG: L,D-transpeptidase [Hyphomicrobiales bacterium]|nr:L,D-transpeptidase [Hyphomicrobiales bacterium]